MSMNLTQRGAAITEAVMTSRLARLVVVLLTLLGSSVLVAAPASAASVSLSTSLVSTMGNAAYEWSDPAPAGQVTLKFVSTTTAATWVFALSSDVRTTNKGTVTFDPSSMVNPDAACTMCIVSRVSGTTTALSNDTYVISMSFPNSAGGTTTSAESTLKIPVLLTFATTIVSLVGRAVYQRTDPAPAGQVKLKFVSSTVGTTWVFGLSSDVQTTTSGTVTYDPRSMINSNSSCTMCVVSKLSGPSTYLPNDVYITSMSYLNTDGTTTGSPYSSLSAAFFAMPATLTPASNTTAGANLLTVSATAPTVVKTDSTSPYNNAARFVIAGTGTCAGKVTTVILVNPSANTPVTVTISYANPPAITSTVAYRDNSGGDALVRGCSYDVKFLYQSAISRPPLPSNADGNFAVTTSTGVLIPSAPPAPTIGSATAGDQSASVSFTPPASNGGSSITEYTVTSNPGGITATGSSSPITVSGLTNGTEYTFTVTAKNGVGTGPASASSSPVTPASAITPVAVTAKSPTTVAYGTAAPALGYTTNPVTAASEWTAEPTCAYYASTDATYSTPLSGVLDAGVYTTHCSGGTSDTLTVSSRVDGSFTVTAAPAVAVTATVSAASSTYGDSAPAISFSAAGFVNGESFSTAGMTAPTCHAYASTDTGFATPVTLSSTTPAGSYVIHCSGGILSSNYTTPVGYIDAGLTIGKATPSCTVTGYTVTFDGNAHTATGSCLGVDGDVLAGLDLTDTTHTDADEYTDDSWSFTDTSGNYTDTGGTVANTIGKASQSIHVVSSAPTSKVYGGTFTVAASSSSGRPVAITASGGCTGSGTNSATVTMTSGTTACSIAYVGVGNANYDTATTVTETTTASKVPTNVLYTGAQILTLPTAMKVSAQTSGDPACASASFALDRNPLTLAPGSYPLVVASGSVSTTGWAEGVYQITVSYGGDSNCALATDQATVTVAGAGAAATGGGFYTLSNSGRVNLGFTVRAVAKTTPTQFKGEIVIINTGKWRLKGTVTSYAKTSTVGAIGGTGTLFWWNQSLRAGLGDWALAATNVGYTASMTASTKTSPGSVGLKITYTPTDAQPSRLPNSAPQNLKGGKVTLF